MPAPTVRAHGTPPCVPSLQGTDGGIFAFLSTPALALNVMTQNATFRLQGQTVRPAPVACAETYSRVRGWREVCAHLRRVRVVASTLSLPPRPTSLDSID